MRDEGVDCPALRYDATIRKRNETEKADERQIRFSLVHGVFDRLRRVRNRGFSVEAGKWKEITGKAYPARSAAEGYLKVSFFGPFYSTYVVF